MALWPRYAIVTIPKPYRLQLNAFLRSAELMTLAPISTKVRVKHVADVIDVKIIIRAFWEDKKHFRTHRMRTQMVATVNLSAISSERPGAIVESGSYRHSNECIQWSDLEFIVVPHKDHPHKPWLVVIVRIRLLKAWRDDESREKFFFLYPEGDNNRASCPIMAFAALALEDHVFKDVSTVEEILNPKVAPTQMHTLEMHEHKKSLAVLRAEVKTPDGWTISDIDALPHGIYVAFLRVFSRDQGFPGTSSVGWFVCTDLFIAVPISPYCLKCHAGNNFESELTEEQRKLMMGHTQRSLQYLVS